MPGQFHGQLLPFALDTEGSIPISDLSQDVLNLDHLWCIKISYGVLYLRQIQIL